MSAERQQQIGRALREAAGECDELAGLLGEARRRRDALALDLVASGKSWREVAAIAGFKNPYIAELKRRAEART